MKTEEQIQDQMNKALDQMDNGTKVPAMSYEEGVHEALLWVLEETNEEPIQED